MTNVEKMFRAYCEKNGVEPTRESYAALMRCTWEELEELEKMIRS